MAAKKRKLEEGLALPKEQPTKYLVQREDQIYCIAPIRDCIMNDKENSLVLASGYGKAGFITTAYVSFLYTTNLPYKIAEMSNKHAMGSSNA